MSTEERDTRIVYADQGGAGWFIAILLMIVIAVGGFYLYNSGAFSGSNDVNVTIDVPKDIVPDAAKQ